MLKLPNCGSQQQSDGAFDFYGNRGSLYIYIYIYTYYSYMYIERDDIIYNGYMYIMYTMYMYPSIPKLGFCCMTALPHVLIILYGLTSGCACHGLRTMATCDACTLAKLRARHLA